MAFDYPVNLDLEGRRAVVFGGGPVAVERVRGLLEAGADVLLVTPELPTDLNGVAVAHRDAVGTPDDLEGAFLAIASGEDDAPVDALCVAARRRGVLFAAIDDVAHSDFGAASTIRRGALQLTISTAGKAPALSKRLRRSLEEIVDETYGELVEVLHRARERMLPRTVPFPRWAAAWEAALEDFDGLLALVREGRPDEAEDRVVRTIREHLDGD